MFSPSQRPLTTQQKTRLGKENPCPQLDSNPRFQANRLPQAYALDRTVIVIGEILHEAKVKGKWRLILRYYCCLLKANWVWEGGGCAERNSSVFECQRKAYWLGHYSLTAPRSTKQEWLSFLMSPAIWRIALKTNSCYFSTNSATSNDCSLTDFYYKPRR